MVERLFNGVNNAELVGEIPSRFAWANHPRPRRPPRSAPKPGLARALPRLVVADEGTLLQGEPDLVQPLDETGLEEGIDLEADRPAVGSNDLLVRQIDGELGAVGLGEQALDLFRRELDRQHAVEEAVIVEDVGEGG